MSVCLSVCVCACVNGAMSPGLHQGMPQSWIHDGFCWCQFAFRVCVRGASEASRSWDSRQRQHSASKMADTFSQWELFVQLQMAACNEGHHFEWTPLANQSYSLKVPICKMSQYLVISPSRLRGVSLNTAKVGTWKSTTLGICGFQCDVYQYTRKWRFCLWWMYCYFEVY